MTVTRASAENPCTKCGNELVDQVDGVCFDCITRPLIAAEGERILDPKLPRVNAGGGEG